MDWMIVENSWNKKPIGAVGFIGNEIAVITAFYEDKDANQNNKVEWHERLFSFGDMKGKSLAEVANHAYANPDILMRDTSLGQIRGKLTTQFAAGLLAEGIYKAYFSRAISSLAGGIASQISGDVVKSFIIKKGMQSAVKKAYTQGMR